ncbi:MAG: hypothetical protein ACP5NZ_02610 [Nanobdellota archaeon]
MEKLNQDFIKFCNENNQEEIKNLPENILKLSNFLEELPKECNLIITSIESFKELLKKDHKIGNYLYWKEIDNRIKFIWQTTGFKSNEILKGIIKNINSENYYSAIILTRALFEYVAALHYYIWKIHQFDLSLNKIKEDKLLIELLNNNDANFIFISEELENVLIKYSFGTRDEFLLKINPEWKVVNILSMIGFLNKNKDFPGSEECYNSLSEYTHPNYGTNNIFLNSILENDKISIASYTEIPDKDKVLELISLPIQISTRILIEGITNLSKFKITS